MVGPDPAPEGAISLELVRRIQAGDHAAWEDLYLRYHDALLLAIRSRLGPGLRARLGSEDVLHSVVLDAMRDLERFEPRAPGSLGHWLHVCVLNKIRSKADYFGAGKRAGAVPLTDSLVQRLAGPAADEPRYLDPRYERLETAVAALPETMREVVLLRSTEGLSNAEAASLLERSPEATSKLYNRALARLGTALGTEESP